MGRHGDYGPIARLLVVWTGFAGLVGIVFGRLLGVWLVGVGSEKLLRKPGLRLRLRGAWKSIGSLRTSHRGRQRQGESESAVGAKEREHKEAWAA
jgi:hypothetical protein